MDKVYGIVSRFWTVVTILTVVLATVAFIECLFNRGLILSTLGVLASIPISYAICHLIRLTTRYICFNRI